MGIFKKISSVLKSQDTRNILDNLEDVLLEAGLSSKIVYETMERLDEDTSITSSSEHTITTLKKILSVYAHEYHFSLQQDMQAFVFVGVNGVGKTTSIAKFIYHLQHTHHIKNDELVVAAGDTFRAGAIEQLQKHCSALSVPIVKQQAGADPAAVVYDALSYAESKRIKYLIADTAGRMNNRQDLMAQLQKIYRLLNKKLQPYQIITFIVLDGNSGLNTISQVEDFLEAHPINALILSKYDGSAKGGSILSVYQQCDVPCAFLGTGETYGDFKVFDKRMFLDDFLSH